MKMKYGFIENASRGELPLSSTVYIHIVPAYRLDDENVAVLLTILKAEGGNIKMNFRLIGQPIGVELKFALSQSHPFSFPSRRMVTEITTGCPELHSANPITREKKLCHGCLCEAYTHNFFVTIV